MGATVVPWSAQDPSELPAGPRRSLDRGERQARIELLPAAAAVAAAAVTAAAASEAVTEHCQRRPSARK